MKERVRSHAKRGWGSSSSSTAANNGSVSKRIWQHTSRAARWSRLGASCRNCSNTVLMMSGASSGRKWVSGCWANKSATREMASGWPWVKANTASCSRAGICRRTSKARLSASDKLGRRPTRMSCCQPGSVRQRTSGGWRLAMTTRTLAGSWGRKVSRSHSSSGWRSSAVSSRSKYRPWLAKVGKISAAVARLKAVCRAVRKLAGVGSR